jgi:pyruvate kinase
MLASMRPDAHILAATTHQRIAARLSLTWGVTPFVTDEITIPKVRDVLRARQMVAPGDVVVFVSMHPRLTEAGRNFIHLEQM